MNLLIVTLTHAYILILFLFMKKVIKLEKQKIFFSPINILFLFTLLYILGFYSRYFFYYDIYFSFISDKSYEIYSLFLFIFFTLFFIFYISIKPYKVIKPFLNKMKKFHLSTLKINFFLKSIFIYVIATILLIVLITKTGISPLKNPLEFRIQAGHNFGILFVLMLYLYSFPFFYSIYLYMQLHISNKVFYFIMFYTVIIFFFFGSRMLLLSLIINFIMIRKIYIKNNENISFIKKSLLIIVVVLFVILYGSYRDTAMETNDFLATLQLIYNNFTNIFLFYISEPLVRFSQFVHFLWVIEYEKNGLLDMQYGQTLLNIFTTYIPRFIYEDKPLFLSMEIQKLLTGTSSTPKTASGYFFAEAYLNLFWFSLFIYPLIAAFILKSLQVLYKLSSIKQDFIFFLIYKDIMWYLYIIYDGFNSISIQLIIILFLLNNIMILFNNSKRKQAING